MNVQASSDKLYLTISTVRVIPSVCWNGGDTYYTVWSKNWLLIWIIKILVNEEAIFQTLSKKATLRNSSKVDTAYRIVDNLSCGLSWDVFHYSQHTCVRIIYLFLSSFCHNPWFRNHRGGSTWLLNGIPSILSLFWLSNAIVLLKSSVLPKLFRFVCQCPRICKASQIQKLSTFSINVSTQCMDVVL